MVLDNGAVFEGTVVLENDHFIDLNIGLGRIRLFKTWIKSRSEHGPRSEPRHTKALVFAETPGRPERMPTWLRDGASAIVPLRDLHRYAPDPAEAEAVALAFLRHFQNGKGADVLEDLADGEQLLEAAFPHQARGLTSYSRRLAAALMVRVLSNTCARPGIRERLGQARMTTRLLPREPGGSRQVEVSLHAGGAVAPVVSRIGVRKGKITSLTEGPAPIPEVLSEIRGALAEMGGKPFHLIPVLEAFVETEVTRSLPGGDGKEPRDPVAEGRAQFWSLRPKDRRYVMSLPWNWQPCEPRVAPPFADFMLRTHDRRCAAMAVTEPGALPLPDLERSVLAQFERSLGPVTVASRSSIAVAGEEAVRLTVEARGLTPSLTYEVLLIVIQNRACQFAAWCRSGEHGENAPRLRAVLEEMRFLN